MTTTNTRRALNIRTLLIITPIVALFAWAGLLIFTRYVPPASIPAFVVVFVLLELALFCTFVPLTYLVTRGVLAKRIARPTIRHALRQSLLFSIFIEFNLLLRVLHSWGLFTALVSFIIIVVVEFLALSGK